MENNRDNFIIIDSNSIIHRAFHALPPLKNKDGKVVNAVYGFLLVLFKLLKEFKPKYFVACFDVPEPTFRKKAYEKYKAQRKKAPDELYEQIPLVKEVLKKFNVPVFEKAGYEGDDIIGTLSSYSSLNNKDTRNIIVSGDFDNLQLVDKNTVVYLLHQGVKHSIIYDENAVKGRYGGLVPAQLVDYKALRGDVSDNIPGVKGIGEKTAEKLIGEYGSIEKLYEALEKGGGNIGESVKEKLLKDKDKAILSRDLSEIRKDVPLEVNMKDCEWGGYNSDDVVKMLEDYNFKSLIKNIPGAEVKTVGQNLKLW